jgi:hypothetical protein
MDFQCSQAYRAPYFPRLASQILPWRKITEFVVPCLIPTGDFPMPICRHGNSIFWRIDPPLRQSILPRRRLLDNMGDIEAWPGVACRVLQFTQGFWWLEVRSDDDPHTPRANQPALE